MAVEKVGGQGNPEIPGQSKSTSGFLDELKSVLGDHLASSSAESAKSSEPAKTTLSVPPSEPPEKIPEPSSSRDGLEINFSFFLRVSGQIGEFGKEAVQTFHRATSLVTSVFLREGGWQGDPIGVFLRASETVSNSAPEKTQSFFEDIIQAGNEGPRSIAKVWEDPNLGYIPFDEGKRGSTPLTQWPGVKNEVPLELLKLALPTASTSSGATSIGDLSWIGDSNSYKDVVGTQFLEQFLDFMKTYAEDDSADTRSVNLNSIVTASPARFLKKG